MTGRSRETRPQRMFQRCLGAHEDRPLTFAQALTRYRFDSPAIGIQSAEGWHEHYVWNHAVQNQALAALTPKIADVEGFTPGRGCELLRLLAASAGSVGSAGSAGSTQRG